MLKYFATPLWAIHTTRGVQDVPKWIPKVYKRSPDILSVACKQGRALGTHNHATHIKYLPPLHLLSSDYGAWIPGGIILCFL